jgi:hypothetical protein
MASPSDARGPRLGLRKKPATSMQSRGGLSPARGPGGALQRITTIAPAAHQDEDRVDIEHLFELPTPVDNPGDNPAPT